MKIATWNVNGLRARLDFVLHWMKARRPTIVGFQELKLEEESFPWDEFRQLGYEAAVYGQRSWNGVAVLSRLPISMVEKGLPGQANMGSRLLSARIQGLNFVTLYCPNGKSVDHSDFPLKLAWLDSLLDLVRKAREDQEELIVCGDFNLCPTELDSWAEALLRGSIFHTEAERSRFRQLLSLGLFDLYREIKPDVREFSWWDYRAGAFHKNEGLRIDLMLGSEKVLRRVRLAEIDREYRKKKDGLIASDHAPVIVELAD